MMFFRIGVTCLLSGFKASVCFDNNVRYRLSQVEHLVQYVLEIYGLLASAA